MQAHSLANQSHFQKNGFAIRLALKQRHKGTRKWPIHFVLGPVRTYPDIFESATSSLRGFCPHASGEFDSETGHF